MFTLRFYSLPDFIEFRLVDPEAVAFGPPFQRGFVGSGLETRRDLGTCFSFALLSSAAAFYKLLGGFLASTTDFAKGLFDFLAISIFETGLEAVSASSTKPLTSF